MKKLLLLIISITSSTGFAQSAEELTAKNRQEQHEKFSDPEKSPLKKADLATFDGLPYYDFDPQFRIEAKFERIKKPNKVKFATTTQRKAVYLAFAKAYFSINGKPQELTLYFSPSLAKQDKYKDYLFIPFTDPTNGSTTYGGGRYLEGRIPDGDTIVLDFNKTYNPYCAYSNRYSCPIVPQNNNITEPVEAGVQLKQEEFEKR